MFHSYCRIMNDQSLQRCVWTSKARFTFKVLKSKDLAWTFAPCHRVSSYPKNIWAGETNVPFPCDFVQNVQEQRTLVGGIPTPLKNMS